MDHVDVANTFFTILTLCADAVVVVGLVAVLGRRLGPVRRAGDALVDAVGPSARWYAWLVAAICTAGSLYYSEIAHFTPCLLCWYQRICMYPLAAILLVGALRRDPGVRLYAAPLVVVGAGVSAYHWLVERVDVFTRTSACSVEAPCSAPWFQELGFVTLAFMALSGFLAIAVLLLVDRAHERSSGSGAPAPIGHPGA